MEEIKKEKIVTYIGTVVFIVFFIVTFIIWGAIHPQSDAVFKLNATDSFSAFAGMTIEQLSIIIAFAIVVITLHIVIVLRTNKKKKICNLLMIIITTAICCVSSIYFIHIIQLNNLVEKQVAVCVEDIKDNATAKIDINKIVTSSDISRKYRYITIDCSTYLSKKIILFKLENRGLDILKKYKVDTIDYASSYKRIWSI